MIKLEDLQQGDVLSISKNPNYAPYELTVIERSRISSKKVLCFGSNYNSYDKQYINQYVTSWKRDGVELLKPEQEEFVFCKIEKYWLDNLFHVDLSLVNGSLLHVARMHLGATSGDYTFIGYHFMDSLDENQTVSDTPFMNRYEIYPFAVFCLTDKLKVAEL